MEYSKYHLCETTTIVWNTDIIYASRIFHGRNSCPPKYSSTSETESRIQLNENVRYSGGRRVFCGYWTPWLLWLSVLEKTLATLWSNKVQTLFFHCNIDADKAIRWWTRDAERETDRHWHWQSWFGPLTQKPWKKWHYILNDFALRLNAWLCDFWMLNSVDASYSYCM